MVAYYDGPCAPWEPVWPCALPTGSEAVTGTALSAASEVLWAMSGRRFGLCTLTVRPCRQACAGGPADAAGWWQWTGSSSGGWGPWPRFYRGVWTNVVCGTCTGGCGCSQVSQVRLPSPVAAVTEVVIDGHALPADAYRVDDRRLLVRTDGGEWPACQDWAADAGQPGTWSVTVQVGEQVPDLGRLAVGELAGELARAMVCPEKCALPRQVQALSRQGVSMQFPDPAQVFSEGRIGLPACDLFLQTYNPNGLRRRAGIYSPDAPAGRMTAP